MSPTPLLVFPLGKILYVADDVILLPGSNKPSVVNLWEVVRLPAGATFSYTLAKLCAIAWMRDGFGTAQFRVDIVDAASIRSSGGVRPTPSDFRIAAAPRWSRSNYRTWYCRTPALIW
jgi:hypothetical protein